MVSRRSFILSAIATGIAPSTHAKKPKSPTTINHKKHDVASIIDDTVRPEFIPSPTRLRKLSQEGGAPLTIELEVSGDDISQLFARARDFLLTSFRGTHHEATKFALEKKYPGYEVIPYIIMRTNAVGKRGQSQQAEIIYMARRKNPKPSGSSDWLLEWVGPLESSLDIDIIGTAPKAKTYEEFVAAKTLGAGTNFKIQGKSVNSSGEEEVGEYMVLATRYPQFAQKDPIVQTPFSEALASPEMIARGKKYFEELQGEVTKLLAQATWSESLRDIEWYKIIQGLILTENMNPAPTGLSEGEEIIHYERELRKVYALLGANREFAFQRSSNMGAKGIVQFTEGAWEGRGEAWDKKNKNGQRTGIRHNYLLPGFRENPDFHTIIGNHVLSVLAACAHVTSQYQEYRESKHASLFHTVTSSVKQVLISAGYNSNNTERVKDLSRSHQNGEGGPMAILDRFYHNLSNKGADETRGYMRKFLFALKSLGYSIPETSFFRLHGYNPRE